MFGHTRGFSGWPIQWNHANCCGADPCCHGNEIGAKIAYLSRTTFKLLLLFFVSRWNRAIFLAVSSQWPLAQNCFLQPQICTKSPITRLVWHIDRRCLHLPGGFRGWPIQWNHAQCCGADPCCHGNEIWARRGVQLPTGLSSTMSVSTGRSYTWYNCENHTHTEYSPSNSHRCECSLTPEILGGEN